ncbi:MAG: hypothetical protein NC355_05770 [Blautia sp.]|nr:hypothetical protein [Blautia sp.]
MKTNRKILAVLLVLCVAVTAFPITAAAKSAVKVQKVTVDTDNDDYDDYKTEIEVEFTSKVQWRQNAKISSVKDNKGETYKGYLTDMDDDDCEIYIKGIKYGRTYTIKISGIKERGAASYGSVTVKAKVPKKSSTLKVKKIEYDEDYDDGRMEYSVDIEFNKNVQHKSDSYVLIKDKNGKSYSTKDTYADWDDDECEVYLSKGLEYGETYTYEIVNVRAKGEEKYSTLKGNFIAR